MNQETLTSKRNKSNTLTADIVKYSDITIPEHTSLKAKELGNYVRNFVANIPEWSAGMIAFMGLPWVGKSSNTPKIQRAAEHALGFVDKDELFHYKKPDGTVLEVGGYVCKKSSAILAMLHSDHFFRAVGEDRRGLMLKDIPSCRRHWGNLSSWWQMTKDIFEWKPTDVRIFLWTDAEKKEKKWAGTIELRHEWHTKGKKVLIAEGVNTGEWHDRVKRIQWETSIKTMKILFDMSVEDSMIRVLRRDHDKKWYSFEAILDHRLREYYYILKLYLEPALQDPETILLSKAREVPNFLESERLEVLMALENLQAKYESDIEMNAEQKTFIMQLIRELHAIFSSIKWVNEMGMTLWRKQKDLKKFKRDYKREKHSPIQKTFSRKELAERVKILKKEIGKIKKILAKWIWIS